MSAVTMPFSGPTPATGAVVTEAPTSHIITCGLCFNVLSKPVTFDCQHSYCMECVRAKLSNSTSDGFACPLCSALHAGVNLRNIESFLNHELANYIQRLINGQDGRLICQWCEEAPAVMHCTECMFVYCVECNVAVHKSAAKRGHLTGKIGDPRLLRNLFRKCRIRGHEEYRLEFYCTRCEEMCCAYCLQVGPHKNHENIGISKAALEIRQRMGRDIEQLSQVKTRIESQANDLNRATTTYFGSYDSVENMITERFEHFRQQLMQKELDLRKLLANLRESGDASLVGARKLFLLKLNAINEATMQFNRLQNGGADYEVLESRSALTSHLKTEVPTVGGYGFKFTDVGDMVITGMDLTLDLHTSISSGPMYPAYSTSPTAQSRPASRGASRGASQQRPMAIENGTQRSPPPPPLTPLRMTFAVDQEIEAIERGDGIMLQRVARNGQPQLGLRSKELFDTLLRNYPEDSGIVSWRVRLESVQESFVGVVERLDSSGVPEGFYWSPTRSNSVDGRLGRLTAGARSLPVCRNGDVLRFAYDAQKATLRICVNSSDRGVILTDLHPRVYACFIFYPGEAVTVLF